MQVRVLSYPQMNEVNKIFSEELFFDSMQRDIARLIYNNSKLPTLTKEKEKPLTKQLWYEILSIVGDYDVVDRRDIPCGIHHGHEILQLPIMTTDVDVFKDNLTEQIDKIKSKHPDKEFCFVVYSGNYYTPLQPIIPKMFTLIGGFLLY